MKGKQKMFFQLPKKQKKKAFHEKKKHIYFSIIFQ